MFSEIDKAIKEYEANHKVMSLEGGINLFSIFGTRYKNEKLPQGRKVRFLNNNGYDSERERASRYFKEGQILTVKDIYVGSWSSDVEFIEFPGKEFNTVMFEDVEGD